jgi:hypothetical protein
MKEGIKERIFLLTNCFFVNEASSRNLNGILLGREKELYVKLAMEPSAVVFVPHSQYSAGSLQVCTSLEHSIKNIKRLCNQIHCPRSDHPRQQHIGFGLVCKGNRSLTNNTLDVKLCPISKG